MNLIFLISLIILLGGFFLQFYIIKVFNEGKKYNIDISGGELLNLIKQKYGLENLVIGEVSGTLSDHFMPSVNKINLSEEVYYGNNISAIAVSLHEFGHALQHKENSILSRIHSFLFPLIGFSSIGSIILFSFGVMFSISGIMLLGILFFSITTIYYLFLSLLEFDASERGYKIFLNEFGYNISQEEKDMFKKMLFVAFLSYFLSFLQSILQLVEMFIQYNNKNNS